MVKSINTSSNATWKQRYRAPSIYYAGIAPLAPERGLVYSNQTGVTQFYAWDVPSNALRQLTFNPIGQSAFLHLSPDGRWLYYLKDQFGNEIGHYVRIPYEGGEEEDITPTIPPYPSFGFSMDRSGKRIGFNVATPKGFGLIAMEVGEDGALTDSHVIYECKTITFPPQYSADGSVAVIMTSEHTGKNEFSLLAINPDTGERINELWDGEGTSLTIQVFSPLPGDQRLAATSNRSGIERLLLWNPLTNERTDMDLDIPGAQMAVDWSADGKQLVVSSLFEAVQSLYLYNLETHALHKLAVPDGGYRAFLSPDGSHLYSLWTDAAHNPRLVELDMQNGAILRTVLSPGDAPAGRPMQSITFPSSDGQIIQGWLCLPDPGTPGLYPGTPGPYPTILETHGGPSSVQTNGFNAGAQAWVDHGFAYLSINYRGSVTFGREFEQKIWHDLGHWEVEDMAAARDWLVQSGIDLPEAIFLTGWSYGGYLTLLGMGKRPDLWAGGMAGIAIADWAVQWEDTADTLRGYQEALFGGSPAEVPERYRESSPITYVKNVRAPVLIIQGRNDTRTPARPVELYEKKMKGLNKKITVHWFEAGHAGSFANPELGVINQEMMMTFAYRALAKVL